MADFYTLTRESIKALQIDHQRVRTAIANLQNTELRGSHAAPQRADYLIGKALGIVPKRATTDDNGSSTTTVQSGNFTVQDVTGASLEAGQDATLTDTGRTEVVYNLGTADIPSGAYVPIERDYLTGTFIAREPATGEQTINLAFVRAQDYWMHSGGYGEAPPSELIGTSGANHYAWVTVRFCDAWGAEAGDPFTCWLTTTPHMDPNVIPGQIFVAGLVDGTEWDGVSGHLDLAIGSVKMMTGNTPTAEMGWQPIDGNQDTERTAGGGALNMAGRVPEANTLGNEKGTINASLFTGLTEPAAVTTSSEVVSVTITDATLTVGLSETGIQGTDAHSAGTIDVQEVDVEGEDLNPVTVVESVTVDPADLEHNHEIQDPGHSHSVTGVFTGNAAAHTHTVPGSSHRHSIEHIATLGVYFYERIDNSDFDAV